MEVVLHWRQVMALRPEANPMWVVDAGNLGLATLVWDSDSVHRFFPDKVVFHGEPEAVLRAALCSRALDWAAP